MSNPLRALFVLLVGVSSASAQARCWSNFKSCAYNGYGVSCYFESGEGYFVSSTGYGPYANETSCLRSGLRAEGGSCAFVSGEGYCD